MSRRSTLKSGVRVASGINASLYLILLVFFFVLSSSSQIDPHRVKRVVGDLDVKVHNASRKRDFIISSFFGAEKLNPDIKSLLSILHGNPYISSFVSNDKVVIQFQKIDFYEKDSYRISEDIAKVINVFFTKLYTLIIRLNLKLSVEFAMDSKISDFEDDYKRLNRAADDFQQLGFPIGMRNKFVLAMRDSRPSAKGALITISIILG